MADIIESYKIGKIAVTVRESEDENRVNVECNDSSFRSEFSISRYEYTYYRRHMNQKILNAYKQAHSEEQEDEESGTDPSN